MKIVRSGFTLAEVLIAIAIFASLVLMAQQVANGLSNVNVVVTEHDHKLKALQQTMSFMSHDLTQIVPRQMRRKTVSGNRHFWLAKVYWPQKAGEYALSAVG